MALLDLLLTYSFQTSYPDPANPGEQVGVWQGTGTAYDDVARVVTGASRTVYVNAFDTPPVDYSRPTAELVDSYTVPTATTAPGYVAGEEDKQATVYHDGNGDVLITYAAGCDLAIALLSATPTTAAGTATGSVSVTLAGSAATRYVRLFNALGYSTAYVAVDAQGQHTFVNVPADEYLVQAYDDSPSACAVASSISVAEFARVGCRNPAATNYDPLATQDGVCTFAPTVATAILRFPEAQSLRLLVPPLPGYGAADVLHSDNTLLAQQQALTPGLVQPGYEQKLTRRDEVAVQWQSTFANHLVQLCGYPNGSPVASFPPRRLVLGSGNVAAFGVYLTAHTSTSQARLYFQAALLPLPLLPGNVLTLSGFGYPALEGNFPIIEVREDTLSGVPYVVLNAPFGQATALLRLDGQATTVFRVAAYDVWQATLSLASVPAGCYYLRVTATDEELGSAQAVSEPLHLAAEHAGTVLIRYRNFDNAFGLNYSFGLENRLRVTARFHELDTDAQKETLLESSGRTLLLSALTRRQRRLSTLLLPAYVHEKLALAFAHDLVTVQGQQWVAEGKYEVNPTDRYGLHGGQVVLTQAEALGSANADDLGDLNQGQGFLIANEGYLRY